MISLASKQCSAVNCIAEQWLCIILLRYNYNCRSVVLQSRARIAVCLTPDACFEAEHCKCMLSSNEQVDNGYPGHT